MSNVVKSKQGYTGTLTIANRKTRKIFAFSTAGKSPLSNIIQAFLERYKLEDGQTRYIRMDQGGELACSAKFRQILLEQKCILEPTGSDAALENGLAKNPNNTITSMTRRLLYLSGLPPKF